MQPFTEVITHFVHLRNCVLTEKKTLALPGLNFAYTVVIAILFVTRSPHCRSKS